MGNNKREKIVKLLDGLYKLHVVYKQAKLNQSKIEINEKADPIFDKLETLGVKRVFSETFLVYGDEFLAYEFGIKWDKMRSA